MQTSCLIAFIFPRSHFFTSDCILRSPYPFLTRSNSTYVHRIVVFHYSHFRFSNFFQQNSAWMENCCENGEELADLYHYWTYPFTTMHAASRTKHAASRAVPCALPGLTKCNENTNNCSSILFDVWIGLQQWGIGTEEKMLQLWVPQTGNKPTTDNDDDDDDDG